MTTILLIYHSQSGNNKKIADAIAETTAKEEGIVLNYKNAIDANIDDVLNCDGIMICSPEYFGYMSGIVKDFFDRTSDNARANEVKKPYCLIICCENDGTGAERSIDTIARGYVLKKAMNTLIIKESELNEKIEDAKELGIGFVNGVKLGIF